MFVTSIPLLKVRPLDWWKTQVSSERLIFLSILFRFTKCTKDKDSFQVVVACTFIEFRIWGTLNILSSSNPVSRASMKLWIKIYHFPILFTVAKYTTHKSSFQVFFIAYILYIVFHVWKENYNMFEMNLINQYLKLLLYMCLSVLTIHFRF